MGNMNGEAAEGVKKFSSEEEKVEDVPCIVKFRPCKDWTGEYGFDWVREGEKDFYKERIGLDGYRDSINALKSVLGDGYDQWEKENMAFYVEMRKREKEEYLRKEGKYYRCRFLQRDEQERFRQDYEKWEAETDETKKDAMLDDLNLRLVIAQNNEIKDDSHRSLHISMSLKEEDFYNNLLAIVANCELKRHNIDQKVWQKNDALRIDESKCELDKGEPPFEYFYAPERIRGVTYKIDRKQFGNVWISEVKCVDEANCSTEAKTSIYQLDYFIKLNGTDKCSVLKNKDGSYSIPYYTENGNENNPYYKEVSFEREEGIYKLLFGKFVENGIGKIKLWVTYRERGSDTPKYELYYQDGFFKYIKDGGEYKELYKVDNNKRKDVIWINENVITPGRALNTALDIEDLMRDDSIDKVELYIGRLNSEGGVQKIKVYDLPKDLPKDKNHHDVFESHGIISWQEAYENTFSPFKVRFCYETDNGSGKQLIKYCVPILSISHAMNERTRFTFNTKTDAPKKDKIERLDTFKYDLQMEFKGKSKEICFESSPDSIVSISPSSIPNPKDGEIYDIQVKYNGNMDPAYVFDPYKVMVKVRNMVDGEPKETIGKLMVRINPPKELHMFFIKVYVVDTKGNRKPFSQKLLDCMKDQEDAVRNALAQVGIRLRTFDGSINVEKKAIGHLYNESAKTWEFYGSSTPKELFIDSFINQYKSFSPYYKWCYYTFYFDTDDKTFNDSTAAYSYYYYHPKYPNIKFKYTISSGSIGQDRTDAYCMAHELLHRLANPHTFQLKNDEYTFPFCFKLASSSNIMDYYTLEYSLHQYQWDNILGEMRSNIINDKKLKRKVWEDRMEQEKRDRLFANKMNEISKKSPINSRK